MDDRPINGVRRAEHGVGVGQAAFLQRRADAGGGHSLALIPGHRHDMDADAQGFAQFPQPFDIARRAGPEGEVIAAEQLLGVEALHQHRLDKILGREGAELVKGGFLVFLDAQGRHAGVLLAQRQDAPAFQRAAHRQFKRESCGGQAVGFGAVNRRTQHGAVAAVDTVKVAQRHRASLGCADGRQALVYLHWAVIPFRKIVFRLSAHRPRQWQDPRTRRFRRRCDNGHRRPYSGS